MGVLMSSLFFSIFLTITIIPILRWLANKFQIVDVPNLRKVHVIPVPRIGGVAMWAGFFVTTFAFLPWDRFVVALLASLGLLVVLGLLDDLKTLDYKVKFLGQICAAVIVIFWGDIRVMTLGNLIPSNYCLTEFSSIILTLILVVGVTNAINLADGLDGLAAGLCLMAFCSMAYLAYCGGMTDVLFLSVCMAGAIFGFLRYNTYPATIFMGDGGSQFLGFTGIVLAIRLTQNDLILSPILPLYFFGLPIVDTLSVMVQRIKEGRSPFHADQNHIHHKLIRLGFCHSEAVLIIYIIQTSLILFALFFASDSDIFLLGVFCLFTLFALAFFAYAEKIKINFSKVKKLTLGREKVLSTLRNRTRIIKFSFLGLKISFVLVLFSLVLIPVDIPRFFAPLCIFIAIILCLFLIFNKPSPGIFIRLLIYLLFPYLIYNSQNYVFSMNIRTLSLIFDFCFFFILLFSVFTLRFTRRKSGFMISPLDFLVFAIIFTILLLPGVVFDKLYVGILTTKIIILFYGFEILIGELRGDWRQPAVMCLALCLLMFFRVYNLIAL